MTTIPYSMRELVEYYIGGGWGKEQIEGSYPEGGYVIRGTDIPGLTVSTGADVPYRFHKVSNLQSRRLQVGDIVMEVSGGSRDQPVGRTMLITPAILGGFGDNVMCASFCKLVRPNTELVEPTYLYWYLQHIYKNREILQYQIQSTGISNLQFELFLDKQRVELPSRAVQRFIADILSAYNTLTRNNTRRIAILEEMAQAIYREWFVNFRFPGHEQVEVMEFASRPIPAGWTAFRIGEVLADAIGGGWGEEVFSEGYPIGASVIRGTDIPGARRGAVENCPLRYHKRSNAESRWLELGDIVFEVSGGSKGQPVGRPLLMGAKLLSRFTEGAICASFCKRLRPDVTKIDPLILYLHLMRIYDDRQVEKYQVQSTGITNFKFQFFLDEEVVLAPNPELQQRFQTLVAPLFDEIQLLGAKNAVLCETRDLLLPKLLSGEIEVPAAEAELEAVPT